MPKPSLTSWLPRANNLLLILIVLVNGYIVVAPLLPALTYSSKVHSKHAQQLKNEVAAITPTAAIPAPVAPVAQPNHVIIPSMVLDAPIVNGSVADQYKIIDKGSIWRYADGSSPDKGGNTILIGHRFSYTGPRGVFYYLNKVSLGDQIGLWWKNHEYKYQVSSITQVPPTDTAIESNTPNAQLTIFTCTPLWLPKNRLVVVAQLETSS